MRTLVTITVFLGVLLVSHRADAACRTTTTPAGTPAVVCSGTSALGKTLVLSFPGERVTRATDHAVLCSDPKSTATEAVLWMPAHGHGSGPTRLRANGSACTVIEDVEFIMSGAWQFRIRFQDGDRGTIDVAVAR